MTSQNLPRTDSFPQVAPATHVTPSGLRIHNIQTGFVAVKRKHFQFDGRDGGGMLAIATDLRWTAWLPIHTWVIEHPEGVIVIDTGETARAAKRGYHRGGDALFYGMFLRFKVTEADEIGVQLQSLGIAPTEVRWVVQTHLHGDHMGGMGNFPNAEFLISRRDYPNSMGALAYHYPVWLQPTLVDFSGERFGQFAATHPITQAGDVFIVPTPGHSDGHQSVVLRNGGCHYFFAGDATFDQEQLLTVATAGIASSPAASRDTVRKIRALCRQFDTVYLPSHDAEARDRLLNNQHTILKDE